MTFEERVAALDFLGLTPRQTRFVATVALHSGYCLRRQYAAFAGLAYGKNTRDFLDALVTAGVAVRESYELNRGHVYHLRANPRDWHHGWSRFTRRFLSLPTVGGFRPRAATSSKNFWTASSTVGISTLITPIVPDAFHWVTRSLAASQDVRSSALRTFSPRREPSTCRGHWQRR